MRFALAQPLRVAAIGGVAGLMAGFFGIGGGAVLVPGMVLVGYDQHAAHATSLAAIPLTAAAAAAGFATGDEIAVWAALALVAGALPGAYLGAAVMARLSDARLRQGFAVLLLVVAVRLAFPTGAPSPVGDPGGAGETAGLIALGVVVGVLSAVMGIGGGTMLVPGVILLFGFSVHTAEGTSLLVIVPTALMGAWRHSRHGYTDWRAGLWLGVAGILTGVVGSQLALALSADVLQRLFALFLAAMSVRLLMRERPRARHAP